MSSPTSSPQSNRRVLIQQHPRFSPPRGRNGRNTATVRACFVPRGRRMERIIIRYAGLLKVKSGMS
jgi:hypothetical protein